MLANVQSLPASGARVRPRVRCVTRHSSVGGRSRQCQAPGRPGGLSKEMNRRNCPSTLLTLLDLRLTSLMWQPFQTVFSHGGVATLMTPSQRGRMQQRSSSQYLLTPHRVSACLCAPQDHVRGSADEQPRRLHSGITDAALQRPQDWLRVCSHLMFTLNRYMYIDPYM